MLAGNNDGTKLKKKTVPQKMENIMVMWLECMLLDTGVDGLNPGISMLCP